MKAQHRLSFLKPIYRIAINMLITLSKGFFRVWCCLSIVWIGGVGCICLKNIGDYYLAPRTYNPFYPPMSGPTLEDELNAFGRQNTVGEFVAQAEDGKLWENVFKSENPNMKIDDWLRPIEHREAFDRRQNLIKWIREIIVYFLIFVAPPATLLLLGRGTLWIMQGFKQSR